MKDLRALGPYLKTYRKPYLLGTLCITLSTTFLIIAPRLVQQALDSLKEGADLDFLLHCSAGIVGVTVLRSFFLFLVRRCMIFASRRIENDLRNDFFAHLQTLSPTFFHEHPTGDLMAVATNDLGAVRQVLGPGIMYSVNTLLTTVFISVNLLLINPLLTGLVLCIMPAMAFLVYCFGRAIHWRFEKIQAQFGTLTTRAQENLAGTRVIRSYVQEEHEIGRFREANEEYVRRNRGYVLVQSAFRPGLTIMMGLATTMLLFVGGEMIVEETITIGEFAAFSLYLTLLIWPTVSLGWVTGLFQRGAASMKRIQRILSTEPLIRDHGEAQPMDAPKGHIRFKDLSFRYDPEGPLVLDKISFDIEPGATVALIGSTGSGKSTLVNLLARLYPVARDQIEIDGIDINDITLKSLRDLFGFVLQEAFLFSDTLENNIALGRPEAPMEAIQKAAQRAAIREEAESFPGGLKTMLGERGINLSGGQKQRTAIARALLKDPRILILDDALSAVDTGTEEAILEQLREFTRNRTVIFIAHRISTVRHADRILYFEGGKIVEQGTHESLIKLNGRYAALNRQQQLKSEIEELS